MGKECSWLAWHIGRPHHALLLFDVDGSVFTMKNFFLNLKNIPLYDILTKIGRSVEGGGGGLGVSL